MKPKKETRNKYLQIRVTPSEHQKITNLAQSMDKTITEIVLEHFESLIKQNDKK